MQEQREAEEELAVFMNRRLVKEVGRWYRDIQHQALSRPSPVPLDLAVG